MFTHPPLPTVRCYSMSVNRGESIRLFSLHLLAQCLLSVPFNKVSNHDERHENGGSQPIGSLVLRMIVDYMASS